VGRSVAVLWAEVIAAFVLMTGAVVEAVAVIRSRHDDPG
jgi:hypothetical protein